MKPRNLRPKEKIIFCGCDAISGLLIHYLLDKLFCKYIILYQYDLQLQQEWKWAIDEPIPDKDIIKEWFYKEPQNILTTHWEYKRVVKAVEKAQINNVHIYEFCKHKHVTDLPF